MPAHGRNHSSQVLTINNHCLLIDCGEGTQQQISRFNVKHGKIEAVFISHLHGDHYLGLMGLISSMHIQGRTKALKVFAPRGLKEILMVQLKYSGTVLNFKLDLIELDSEILQLVFQTKIFTVESFPLKHRIPCFGFLIREKAKPVRINKKRLPADISIQNIAKLKKGLDVFDEDGKILYQNEYYTLPPRKQRSYAYCSDTIYDEDLLNYISEVDILYHESTFLEEREQSAKDTFHTTARQAGLIARKAKVNKLIIGHFSARYKEINSFREEASLEFDQTVLAIEGKEYSIGESD